MLRLTSFLVALLIGCLCTSGARADSSTLSTDQLLSTLASVISDRAKSVAAHAIQRRLSAQLCGKSLVLDPGGGFPKETITLGGSADCKKNEHGCDANDQFVGACRLIAGNDAIPLQDAAFLRALSEDTITFAVRLAAVRADKTTLNVFQIRKVALFLARITRQVKRSDASIEDIVDGLIELERAIGDSQQVARTMLDQIRQTPGAVNLLQQLMLQPAAPSAMSQALVVATVSGTAVTVDRGKFTTLDEKVKSEIYDKEGRVLASANLPCANGGPPDCPYVQRGRVVVALAKLWFKTDDYTRDLRNLGHVLRQYDKYQLGADKQHAQLIDDIRNAVSGGANPGPPPYLQLGLSSALEFGAYLTLAEATSPAEISAWLGKLRADMAAFLSTCTRANDPCDYGGLLDGAALQTPSKEHPLPQAIDHARGALKTLLGLPWLVTPDAIAAGQDYLRGVLVSIRRLVDQLDGLAVSHANQKWTYQDAVRIVPALLRVTSATFGIELRVPVVAPGATPPVGYQQFAAALNAAADAFDEALDQEWVALATTAYQYSEQAGAPPALQHALAFTRLLLSVREAQTKDEAKGQFEAALEDEGSREKRWSGFSVDIGAIVGARGAYGTTRNLSATGAKNWQDEHSGGLYAPVGVMIGDQAFGLLVYPVDVGAYLVGSNHDGDPTWPQALRGGVAVSLRPWSDIPIAFSASFDGRPAWRSDTPANVRAGLSAGLELPLFLLD
jgi:hypothetical protein